MSRYLLLLSLTIYLVGCTPGYRLPAARGGEVQLTFANAPSDAGFARVIEPREFVFPQDHGPHPDFQTEWWYYTGNLRDGKGERFSYQLTIFRRGLSPETPGRGSALATDQIYFAHFAIAAVDREIHRYAERFSRAAPGLAGGRNQPFEVYLEDWQIEALDAEGSAVRLKAAEGEMALDLSLRAVKPIVAHGEGGVSAKSSTPGNASYYLSFTRMDTKGIIQFEGDSYEVQGSSWFDHEWSTSALAESVRGWDWFSLQLDHGEELMLYLLRNEDGGVEAVSAGTLIRQDGSIRNLTLTDFEVEALEQWQSPDSDAIYPSEWLLTVPDENLTLTVTPSFDEQEMIVSFTYWEGSVTVQGLKDGQPVRGVGFVELTGYAQSMAGIF